jgi:tetratricopeptide (TPR) repeat protein
MNAPIASPQELMHQGLALARAGQDDKAIDAFHEVIRLKRDFVDAWYELASALHRQGQWDASVDAFHTLLRLIPGHVPAKLGLGAALIDARRPVDAEVPLRRALSEPAPPPLKAALYTNLALALRRQRRDEEALTNYDQARVLNPSLQDLPIHRAEALQNLNRHDEALAEYQEALSRDPQDARLHRHYNALLYRLGRMDEFLKSYDRAPRTPDLQRSKALFLRQTNRSAEAHELYRDLLTRDPADVACMTGAAHALVAMGRLDEAARDLDNGLLKVKPVAPVLRLAAEVSILRGDPDRALGLCRQALKSSPFDQACLAMLGVCLRLMDSEQDELLNGYNSLVGIFDLPPPQGYSSIEDFNAELGAYLMRLHPRTREHIDQSLRYGTQTPDHIFGAGHVLVDKLEAQIRKAIAGYVGALREDRGHPFLSRRSRQFRYAGSWSSHLTDCGFHTNHVHPAGWISSCYYVAIPDSAADAQARQGWLKLGEPGFAAGIAPRRTVQPVPGRLVLFPSYMWHGTIPFRGVSRLTLAFDAVPVA